MASTERTAYPRFKWQVSVRELRGRDIDCDGSEDGASSEPWPCVFPVSTTWLARSQLCDLRSAARIVVTLKRSTRSIPSSVVAPQRDCIGRKLVSRDARGRRCRRLCGGES